ncbi:hypothetical protein KEM55_005002 [Ascosphaera atra]|nr:hypothetical protein KEM55_005002 [Ascosphaera atra]
MFLNEPSEIEYEQFILFGDSITEWCADQKKGFVLHDALQNDYSKRYDVLIRGFSGYNSEQGLWALEKFFPAPEKAKVKLMTVFFGANDATYPGHAQHVPLDGYEHALKSIITYPRVKDNGTKLLIITPPPVNEYPMQPDPVRKAARTKQYADAAKKVAAEMDVPVVDIWTRFMEYAGWKEGQPIEGSLDLPPNEKLAELLVDGLHLTPLGYELLYKEIKKVIAEKYPEESPEKVPQKFIRWVAAPKRERSDVVWWR